MKQQFSIIAALLLLTGCSGAKFLVANLGGSVAPADRTADLAYGSGPRQKLDVYTPATTSATAQPVIVFLHGGAWDAGSKNLYRFVGDALAARGFVAVLPSYRLYPQVRFPVFVEDAALAVEWVRLHAAEYGGDPGRIFLMGHSAGAQMAMLLALDQHYLKEAGMDAGDLRGVIGLSGPYDFLPFGSGFHHEVFDTGGDLLLTQPIHFARAGAPPVLLLYGSADEVVAPRNSESLAAALGKVGARVTLKRYAGKSHADTVAAFSGLKRNRAPVLEDVAAFIAQATAAD